MTWIGDYPVETQRFLNLLSAETSGLVRKLGASSNNGSASLGQHRMSYFHILDDLDVNITSHFHSLDRKAMSRIAEENRTQAKTTASG